MNGSRSASESAPRGRDYCLVGTAGHIDHGKSALVRELTGTDPDRLQEEKDRGITIDLGFAHLELGIDLGVGFIDVPGHERFVKNMLAGIGGIDAVLLVVAADESVKPQTREHFAICRLLDIRDGVVAITKCDLVDEEIVDLVELEVRELLTGSFLADAAIVRTSVVTGAGLDELTAELEAVLRRAAPRTAGGLLRLPVDRVFTVKGFGTVVTGTLLTGAARVGDALELLPSGLRTTVRGLQVHSRPVELAHAGQRTAMNLQGVDVEAITRGDLLVTPGSMSTTHLIDARLQLLDEFGPLRHLQRVRFHHGAAEVLARVAVLEGEEIPPGGSALVQLRLERRYAVAPGDRFIIRRYSPMVTLGGGVVVDPLPAKHRRSDASDLTTLEKLAGADPTEMLTTWVRAAGRGGARQEELRHRLVITEQGLRRLAEEATSAGRVVEISSQPLHLLDADLFGELQRDTLEALAAYHARNPLRPGMPKREASAILARETSPQVFDAVIEALRNDGSIRIEGENLSRAEHAVRLSPAQVAVRDSLLTAFAEAGLSPPPVDQALSATGASAEEAESMLHHLLREGELVRLRDDLVFHAAALDELVRELRRRHGVGEQFSVPQFKEWTKTSRKHAIPLLEHLDRTRVTRRVGDNRELI